MLGINALCMTKEFIAINIAMIKLNAFRVERCHKSVRADWLT